MPEIAQIRKPFVSACVNRPRRSAQRVACPERNARAMYLRTIESSSQGHGTRHACSGKQESRGVVYHEDARGSIAHPYLHRSACSACGGCGGRARCHRPRNAGNARYRASRYRSRHTKALPKPEGLELSDARFDLTCRRQVTITLVVRPRGRGGKLDSNCLILRGFTNSARCFAYQPQKPHTPRFTFGSMR
jgi:hypothetical protein